jgi:predicted HTH transcriptional regulator
MFKVLAENPNIKTEEQFELFKANQSSQSTNPASWKQEMYSCQYEHKSILLRIFENKGMTYKEYRSEIEKVDKEIHRISGL